MNKGDDNVGYGQPPKHTRYAPGESGNKGRKKKRPEYQAEMIARIRDEPVIIGGKTMTAFEVAIRSVYQSTIKRGNPRDLKNLLDILDKYGAIPKGEAAEASRAAADQVMLKIEDIFNKTLQIDPQDVAELDRLAADEAAFVMRCPDCSPYLRQQWHLPERKALGERYDQSGLQSDVARVRKREQQ